MQKQKKTHENACLSIELIAFTTVWACRPRGRHAKPAEKACRSIERHAFPTVFACRSIERHEFSAEDTYVVLEYDARHAFSAGFARRSFVRRHQCSAENVCFQLRKHVVL